jgi:hypothetical protein
LADAKVQPEQAYYNAETGLFLLLYEDVRNAPNGDETLMNFLQSTYEAGANLAKWDRPALERHA